MLINSAVEEGIVSAFFRVENAKSIAFQNKLDYRDFFISSNGAIYRAVCELWNAGMDIDFTLTIAKLRDMALLDMAGGADRVESLALFPPCECSEKQLSDYIRDLQGNRVFRKKAYLLLARYANRVADMEENGSEIFGQMLLEAQNLQREWAVKDESCQIVACHEVLEDMALDIQAIARGERKRPVSTGLPPLDSLLTGGGLPSGRLVVVGARPGMGKTTLNVVLASNVAKQGYPVMYLSCEEPKEEIVSRLLINHCDGKIDRSAMKNGTMSDLQWDEFWAFHEMKLPIYIADPPGTKWSVGWIEEQLQNFKNRTGVYPRVLFLDYLNLWVNLQGDGKDESSNRAFYSHILARLQGISKEYDIAAIAVCQFNRATESRSDKRPQLSDFRDTGSIEEYARLILAPYREDYWDKDGVSTKPGTVEIHILKQNDGQSGVYAELDFIPHRCQIKARSAEY